ncbi:MAG: T9SS type A sorting domain-containing protein [Bacteroidales bacterium]|nr:T9SS type A sorting domain-containing protein [Bacteroidales bacterium]
MKFKNLILTIFFGFSLFSSGFSQNLEWEWSAQNTQKDASAWSYILDIDYQNNIYTGTQYGDSIFFGDTLFAHTGYYDWANWAIAKYDNQGNFLNAFDITSIPNNNIYEVVLATDKDMNMYIACEFQQLAYLLDSTIYHGNVPLPGAPEIFLAKITPSLKIEWIRIISSPTQDNCCGLAISSDNFIYMPTKHYGNGTSIHTVNYFDQDSAVYEYTICSLLKIDLDGNLVWRKELFSNRPGITIKDMNIDNSNNITLNGYLRDNLYYSDDTIFHPHMGENMYRSFILEIDTSGELISGIIPDWYMALAETKRDDFGNFYFAGFVWDTVYFGSDTLTKHEDSTVNILAKLNSDYEPVWHQTTKAKSAQGSYYFHIDLLQDTLFFAGRCRSIFTIFDTVFNVGPSYEGFIGQVTPNGELEKFTITNSGEFETRGIKLDNCNNLMVSGRFKGNLYLGQDTLGSYSFGVFDGIISKIKRYDPYDFSIGSDTTVCDSIILVGPEGYQYYYCNNNLLEQSRINISESGEYVFACTNDDGCWTTDTINITVQPGFTINIGQDTIIKLLDTIYLSVPDIYDSCLWSTGSTENSIKITGSTLGSGNWKIWVEVIHGVCTANDTIQLTIPELPDIGVVVYPNPAYDVLYLFSEKEIEKIEIFDFRGKSIIMAENQNLLNNQLKIDLSNISSGIYFIKIYFNDFVGIRKIIKL